MEHIEQVSPQSQEQSERQRIVDAIASICATLKGPGVSNVERLMLNEDRRDLRARLASIDSALRLTGEGQQ